jgi:hypothetical protein
MSAESDPKVEHAEVNAPLRVNGIALLAVLVVAGMGITGVYYHIKAPKILAEMRRTQGEMPASAEGRVGRWLDFGKALIDQRLVQLRLSPRQPWLVSYAVASAAGDEDQEIWGVDMSGHSVDWTTREGMNVVVTLPEAKLLGRGELTGDMARNVPRYAAGAERPDANARARYVVEWALERLATPLAKDIEGARLIVRVGPSSTPESAPNNEGR